MQIPVSEAPTAPNTEFKTKNQIKNFNFSTENYLLVSALSGKQPARL